MRPAPPDQDLLRAVGSLLDREGWRDISVSEEPDGLTVRGCRPEGLGREAAEAPRLYRSAGENYMASGRSLLSSSV
jgi:hypothetical protein